MLEAYLPHTIDAIRNAEVDYEIIVVDDCSKDNSVEFIKTVYPEITLIESAENKGFSNACNKGIVIAQYQLILLLNSDVKLSPDYFEHQWKYFLGWDTFGVMGRIIDMEGDHIQDAARIPKFKGFKLKTDYFCYIDEENKKLSTYYLSGANALVDAAKLKQMGGFYEIFSPFYCEDMELSIRAWRLKWKCFYEHNAVCRHRGGASTNYSTSPYVKSINHRNRFYFHAIHLDGWWLFGWYLQIVFVDLLPRLISGQRWIWKNYVELFKNRDQIREYRKKVATLMEEMDTQDSLEKVVGKIKASVKAKRIIKVEP